MQLIAEKEILIVVLSLVHCCAVNPLMPTKTHILALGFLVITRQLLQLERCSNPLQMREDFLVLFL